MEETSQIQRACPGAAKHGRLGFARLSTLCVVFAAILLVVPLSLPAAGIPVVEEAPESQEGCGDRSPHAPIQIHGDEDFLGSGSGVVGGSGTIEDPFIISDWCISGHGRPVHAPSAAWVAVNVLPRDGILLSGTSAHVVIQGNLVDGSPPGVSKIAWEADGITLREATNVTVRGNTIENHHWRSHGIHLWGSSGNTIEGNFLNDSGDFGHGAIELEAGSSGNVIRGNVAASSGSYGIIIYGGNGASDANLVEGNTVTGSETDGIRLRASHHNVVRNNTVADTRYGIFVTDSSSSNRIENNTVTDQRRTGIHLWTANENLVQGNVVEENHSLGIVILRGQQNQVLGNTVARNGADGIGLFRGSDATIERNIIEDNGWWEGGKDDWAGIRVFKFEDATIVNNNIDGNRDAGLKARNVTAPVDVRNNWWGAASGPSGGVQDACTGSLAEGDGSRLSVAGAEVCFDPWRATPNVQAGAG